MDINSIVEMIIGILPSVIAVLTTVGVVVKVLKEFTALKKEVTNMKAMEEVKEQLKMVIKENYELKVRLDKTIAKIDHIHYEEK